MSPLLAKPGQVIDVWSTWSDAEAQAVVLRTDNMEVVRLHLNPGVRIPTHESQGEITILCVQGSTVVTAQGNRHQLSGGQLLYLLIQEPFELEALQESSLVITTLRNSARDETPIGESRPNESI